MGTDRTVIMGETSLGVQKILSVSQEGYNEVALRSPLSQFGSLLVENLTPIFQADSVYGVNLLENNVTTGINGVGSTSASVAGTNNLFKCSTGTTALSFASIQSRKRLRYRPGQGILSRFTALFSTPIADSTLVAGIGTAESGFYFGYNNTSFGILHATGGVREIQKLTITTASTATNNYVITLNDVVFNITATSNSSTLKTAYEIASGTYTGWSAEQVGSTITFLADSAGPKIGAFTLAQAGAGTPSVGTFSETNSGVATTDIWIPQVEWNCDNCSGSGGDTNLSGFNLIPSFGNVYQIGIQYLGFGTIKFEIEIPLANNKSKFITVHTIAPQNIQTTTSVNQPAFPFTMAAYSAGSVTNIWVACASYAGFIEGILARIGPRLTFDRETSSYVGSVASTYYPLFTIRNSLTHSHTITERANQSVVNLISLSASHDDATPLTFFLIRKARLVGIPNFIRFSTDSCIYQDQASTTCTIDATTDKIFALCIGQSNGGVFEFTDRITIEPGEVITVAARAVTGTATYVIASLNTREDQ
jgi:hypothetical protein